MRCIAVIIGGRAECEISGRIIESTWQTADMVFMCMGAYNDVEVGDTCIFEDGINQAGIRFIAAVNHHVVTIAFHKGGVSLSNINKVN